MTEYEKTPPGIQSHARGTYYIPHEGLHYLHKGEQVVPRGSGRSGGGNVHVHLDPINVNAVLKHSDDVEEIGLKIGRAISAGIVTGVGSKFEVG